MNGNEALLPEFSRVQRRALMAGVVILIVSVIGGVFNPNQFFRSYLVAYLFWLAFTLGCWAILMLHQLVGGNWGFMIRRILESGSATLPLMAIATLPLLVEMPRLYVWARPAFFASTSEPHFKRVYLAMPFFVARIVIYFALWALFVYLLNKWSTQQDRTADVGLIDKMTALSGPGLVLYGLTITGVAVDFAMSLEPDFFSTIYGLIFVIIPALVAMSLAIIVARQLALRKPLSDLIGPSHFHDYGNLMLVFTMLWAYLSFCQFLIIWAGNLQDEIPWYVTRANGSWGAVALVLVVFHFAVPFLLLLQRAVTKRMDILSWLAGAMIIMEWVDLYWIVEPAFYPNGVHLHWLDILLPVGIGGIWIAWFVARLKGQSVVPLGDPRFEGAFSHGE